MSVSSPAISKSFCQSIVFRFVSRKSVDWFWSRSSTACPSMSREVQFPVGAKSADSARAEFSKSWSTGAMKKSEYSDVPSAYQARSPSVTGPAPARTDAVNDVFSKPRSTVSPARVGNPPLSIQDPAIEASTRSPLVPAEKLALVVSKLPKPAWTLPLSSASRVMTLMTPPIASEP